MQSALSLAGACGYPSDYFADLSAGSDEELEVERNAVRDLLRALAGSNENGLVLDKQSHMPLPVSLKVLSQLLHQCDQAVSSARHQRQLVPETVVHAFSSLGTSTHLLCVLIWITSKFSLPSSWFSEIPEQSFCFVRFSPFGGIETNPYGGIACDLSNK